MPTGLRMENMHCRQGEQSPFTILVCNGTSLACQMNHSLQQTDAHTTLIRNHIKFPQILIGCLVCWQELNRGFVWNGSSWKQRCACVLSSSCSGCIDTQHRNLVHGQVPLLASLIGAHSAVLNHGSSKASQREAAKAASLSALGCSWSVF